jgi:2,4-dienoyl-CoA reductase-like NADH-dependent reductase (Old Yellow Enzyme family)
MNFRTSDEATMLGVPRQVEIVRKNEPSAESQRSGRLTTSAIEPTNGALFDARHSLANGVLVSDSLFEPFSWRRRTFPTKVIFAPVNPGFAKNGRPTARFLRFQRQRSGGAIGLSYVGNVAVARGFSSNSLTATFETDDDKLRYGVLRRAVSRAGSLAGIQLALSPLDLAPRRGWRVEDEWSEIERLRSIVRTLDDMDIVAMLSQFASIAAASARIAFDVIQIHAAHGYLLSLLLEPLINERTGSFQARGSWLEDFIYDLRKAVNSSLLSFRVNARSGLREPAAEAADGIALAVRLCDAGVDMIDFSAGIYTLDRRLIYPAALDIFPNLATAIATAERLQNPIVFSGGVHDLRRLPILPPNVFVGVGRALIADPLFATKSRDGDFERIAWCQRTNQCHYFSRGADGISCGVNEDI